MWGGGGNYKFPIQKPQNPHNNINNSNVIISVPVRRLLPGLLLSVVRRLCLDVALGIIPRLLLVLIDVIARVGCTVGLRCLLLLLLATPLAFSFARLVSFLLGLDCQHPPINVRFRTHNLLGCVFLVIANRVLRDCRLSPSSTRYSPRRSISSPLTTAFRVPRQPRTRCPK